MNNQFIIKQLPPQQGHLFFQLIENNSSRLEDYFPGTLSENRTLKDSIQYCKEIEQRIKNKSYFPYVIMNERETEFIGLVDFKNIDWRIPKAEIGYFIDHRYEGRGIISRSVAYVIEIVVKEHGFKKLLCRANAGNLGSVKVALKNDFKLEGIIRRDFKTNKGELVDMNYYGKLF